MDSIARRFFLKLLAATGLAAATTEATTGCSSQGDDAESDEGELASSYEYIVVGSGAGGGPLAANLARAGHRVLLLEAGEDKGERLTYQVPAFHTQSTEDDTMRWDYWVKHYDDPRELDSKDGTHHGHQKGEILYPRAGTLGGCTSHNAMITVYPHESDWDGIADLTGDDSWRGVNMRRYFEILEKCEYLRPDEGAKGHGFKGWLKTTRTDTRLALTDLKLLTVIKAAARTFTRVRGDVGLFDRLKGDVNELLGLMRRDLNAATPGRDQAEGIYQIPLAIAGNKRNGTRELLLETARRGFPLTIKTGAYVTRVLFDDAKGSDGTLRAIGVEFRDGKHLYKADPKAVANPTSSKLRKIMAKREVILAAGAFNTPQLLKLSGVGPKEELEQHGIKVRVDLPGVGTNLQDRYEVGVVSEVRGDFGSTEECTFGQGVDPACIADDRKCTQQMLDKDPCLAAWKRGEGVYLTNGAPVGLIMKSTPDKKDPDLFIFGGPAYFKGYEPGYSNKAIEKGNRFTWAVLKAHTENRGGTVTLRSNNPFETPDINFKYFHEGTPAAAERDLEAVAIGVEIARKIGEEARDLMAAPVFGRYDEIVPGPSVKSRDDIKRFIRNEAWGHHASCTCPMGKEGDPMAVLDSRFRVRGTSGLRVVDASVFPKIPGFFIVVPIYMVSEKATDVLLAEIGEKRREA